MIGKHKISVETASLADGDSIAAYLVDAAGTLLTSTDVGGKKSLDVNVAQSALPAGAATEATLASVLTELQQFTFVGDSLKVTATLDEAGDYQEDSAHSSGAIGYFNLGVRRDARSSGTDADGDYASLNLNASGELWVKDADVLAQLVTLTSSSSAIQASASAIEADVDAIRIEQADQGTSLDSIKANTDRPNSAPAQQRISVTTSATALPTTANRKVMMVQNAGSSSVFIGSSTVTTAGATAGIEIPKGGFIEVEAGPGAAFYAITAAGSVNVNVLELI